jgi:hypothetical protein
VRIAWNHTVDEIVGDQSGVNGVRIKPTDHGGTIENLDVTGAFIAIGHTPNTGIFAGQLEMREGYIVIKTGSDGGATFHQRARGYLPLATSPITCIVRPSHPPEADAWLLSMRTSTSTSISDIDRAPGTHSIPVALPSCATHSWPASKRRAAWAAGADGFLRPFTLHDEHGLARPRRPT